MWPSGVKHSFGGFCGSMFVVGAGLATLETAADPFLSICGPPRYSEIRLNLAQAFQAVGRSLHHFWPPASSSQNCQYCSGIEECTMDLPWSCLL